MENQYQAGAANCGFGEKKVLGIQEWEPNKKRGFYCGEHLSWKTSGAAENIATRE